MERKNLALYFFGGERLLRGLALLAIGTFGLLNSNNRESIKLTILRVRFEMKVKHHALIEGIFSSNIFKNFLKIFSVSSTTWLIIFLAIILYSLLLIFEGIGIILDYAPAEKIAVISTAFFLPFEIFELIKGLTLIKILAITLNILLVLYLYKKKWRK